MGLWPAILLVVTVLGLSNATAFWQERATVPSPPAELRDRFGIYNWGVDYTSYPAGSTVDRLNWGVDKVAEIGSRTIRVAMPGDIYAVGGMNDDLAQAAASPAYDKLFSDSRFATIMLTVKSSTEVASGWADGYTQEEYNAVRDEIARLGDYLLTNPKYAGKTFIIFNWEGDNAMTGYENKQTIWDAYTAWIQSRADGVKLARGRNPASAAKLYIGLEFNLVRDLKTGKPCGTPVADPIREDPLENRCVIDYVAPRVDVDYYSLSSWWTLDVKGQGLDASYKDALKADLNFALAKVRERRPEIAEANFIIGEYGMHRTRWGETIIANFTNEFFDAVTAPDAFQVSYAIYWQIIDNGPGFYVGDDGFGLFRSRNGILSLTRSGETFKRRLAGQDVPKWTGGPFIRRDPPGVIDLKTDSAQLQLDSVLQIDTKDAETPFSATGNRVSIEQGIHQYLLPRDEAMNFTESESRITATLPQGLRPSWVAIYVSDKNGVESETYFTILNCAVCPQVNTVEDERALREFYPGGVVTIFGDRFSPTGNTIIIEQHTEQQAKLRFVVPRADVIDESPEMVTFKLPLQMISSRFTAIIVANTEGNESNQYPIQVYAENTAGPPKIAEFRAIINRDTGRGNIPPGSVITIPGGRFSASGNTVIIGQGTQRFTVVRDTNWSESPNQITAKLPDGVQSGRAQVYVINAQGRESRAVELAIARLAGSNRPPIRRDR
jgi:hypothetical protein